MRKARPLLLAMAMALLLPACGTAAVAAPEPEAPAEAAVSEPAEASQQGPDPIAINAGTPMEAYSTVLWDAFQYGQRPGHHDRPDHTYSQRASCNSFALFDVDGDGRDELLLRWPDSFVADMSAYIWEFRDGALYEELRAFPEGLVFYEGGTVHIDWSHNQGFAGDSFWPYFLYAYNVEIDQYSQLGAVDAWDKSYYADGFPENADLDGDGMVYYLLLTDEDRADEYAHPVDGPAYMAWLDGILQDAPILDIPWQPLSREIIAALGYPEPEMPDLDELIPG